MGISDDVTKNLLDAAKGVAGDRTKVYVAGQFNRGDVAINVREAMRTSSKLLALGYAPYCPPLTHFWHMMFEHDDQTWSDLNREWMTCCDAMLYIPSEAGKIDAVSESLGVPDLSGTNPSGDMEIEMAISLGIPVFISLEAFTEAVPAVGLEGVVPDPVILQLEELYREAGRDGSAELPRGIPETISVTSREAAAPRTLQYNAELPKGVPDEVSVMSVEKNESPEQEIHTRPLKYKGSATDWIDAEG